MAESREWEIKAVYEPPELIELCTNCESPTCQHGDCEKRRNKLKELNGATAMRREFVAGDYRIVSGMRISEAARLAGVSYARVWHRMRKDGMTLEQAIYDATHTAPKRGNRPLYYTAFGRTLTVKQWGARSGINYQTLNTRMRHGMSMEEALELGPGRPKHRRKT